MAITTTMTSVTQNRIPSRYLRIGEVMSNQHHTIDQAVAARLAETGCSAMYSGWDFCGDVWWTDPNWSCEVWVWHEYQKTFEAPTLEGIMEAVSAEYGNE